ncbi:TPA: cytochrome B [Candidatus Dependentiae bacterium]|nr:MAG: hypothetical protein US03_C0004G0074 [candidate division TM6 bacterium GW2011_GWF2_36_131]KKQ03252.1 MAG: hypothetical protein US13_C0004G0074 [candidate division TM6 bacterium GW2011_GWE2_36_25]KKQ19843.1 MAG: hypothetical protein US32_C0004G0027 [candidate division TM6 bacterium GW2011_GWA2_36_9]HBR70319.1 cytochrome B [Candidatus Dependentiae bacterium]HCU00864.1 cytochrome B [Candidatus Dependentiae bacterium]
MIKRIYKSVTAYVHHPFSSLIFAFLFFIEAIFFIPVDPLLIIFCLQKRERAYFYACLATFSSVLGGIAAYFIGAMLFDSIGLKIINIFSSTATFNRITNIYHYYEAHAVLFAGFTPFPYKIITLSAGFCKLPIVPFIMYSLIGRGARFFLIAFLIKRYGKQIQRMIDKYFNYFVIIFTIIVLLCMVVLK